MKLWVAALQAADSIAAPGLTLLATAWSRHLSRFLA